MKIGVVIVTYNRLALLKKVLKAFDEQTFSPTYILIVNNASTDGTGQFLTQWQIRQAGYEKYVYTMVTNTGGSGGFAKGLSESINKDANWIWVSDDDAIPQKDALEKANLFLQQYSPTNDLSAICGTVINEGKIDIIHRRRVVPGFFTPNIIEIPENEYKKPYFELNCFSYVGTIINKKKMQQVGVTNKDYFIWYDDTEHSLRLSKIGKILCVPAIRVQHDTGWNNNSLSWKTYYGFRNRADIYRKYMPFRLYLYFYLSNYLKIIIKRILHIKVEQTKMVAAALRDSRKGKFGIHEVYKPGWKSHEKG